MKTTKVFAAFLALLILLTFALAACSPVTPATPPTPNDGGDGGNGEVTPPSDDKPTVPVDPPIGSEPRILFSEATVLAGTYFNPLTGVNASDSVGNDISEKVTVSGEIDTSVVGQYSLVYSVTDSVGNVGKAVRNVNVVENEYLGTEQPVWLYTSDESYNIAQGCNAFADSENDSSAAAKAFDGNENTRWESVHGVDNVNLTVDLGAVVQAETVVIVWEAAYARSFEVLVSEDGEEYISAARQTDFSFNGANGTFTAALNKQVRYVRLHCSERATNYGYSVYEFKVFGKQGTVIPASKYPVLFDAETQSSPDWQIADEQWVQADLGSVQNFNRIQLDWVNWLSPASYAVKVSQNGTDFDEISLSDGYIYVQNQRAFVNARYVRVEMYSRKFYCNAYRITRLLPMRDNVRLTVATVTASSVQSGSSASNVAVDSGSYWESSHSQDPQTVDLGEVKAVGRVDLVWKGDDGRKGKYYDLLISTDGNVFTTVFRQTHGGLERQSVYVFADARYIRVIDYQNADPTRFMLEGITVHSQYPNEQKADYDVQVQFPEYEVLRTKNGSYLTGGTDFPTAKLVTFLDDSLRNKPVPSNDWWQSLLINDKGHNMYLNPLTAKFDNGGLWLTNPGDGYYSGDNPGNGRQTVDVDVRDICVGFAGANSDCFVKVVGYDDYSVTAVMSDTDKVDKMTVYLSQGALYGYFVYAEPSKATVYADNLVGVYDLNGNRLPQNTRYVGDAVVVCVRTHASYEGDVEQGNARTYEERFYVVNAPAGTTFVLKEKTLSVVMSGGNVLSVGAMSSVIDVTQAQYGQEGLHGSFNAEEAALMHEHGYAFVVGTYCDMTFDGETNLVNTEYRLQVQTVREGYSSEAYSAFMPHQYKKSAENLADSYAYKTVRGDSRAYVGNVYRTSDRFYGIIPQFAEPTDGYSVAVLTDLLLKLYNNVGGDKAPQDCNLISGDPYWQGKNLHPMAMAALAADQIGATDLRDGLLAKIRFVLEDWFTYTEGDEPNDAYFYYDGEWGTLYYKNSEFGAGVNLADHHFTYGYYTFAAGVLCAYQADFAAKYSDMIELLIRDYMNWERDDNDFPFMRNFDVYAGHGWAGGYADNDGGNNQESAGEALNSWVGAYLYATAVNNETIRQVAICGFTTELNAIKQYWFNYGGDSFGEFYPYGAIGQLYGASNFFGTFFNGEPLYAYGIHLIPGEEFLTSYAIGEEEQAALESVMDGLRRDQARWNLSPADREIHAWQHIFIPIVACYDAQEAIDWYESTVATQGNVGNDSEQFNVYYIIHALNGLGSRTNEIWAKNGASATVYKKGDAYSALVWNPSSQPAEFVFVDEKGETGRATVPAQTLAICDPRENTESFDSYVGADNFALENAKLIDASTAAGTLNLNGGTAEYLLSFGRTAVYRKAVIEAQGEVKLYVDGNPVELAKTANGYESAPLTYTFKHRVTLSGNGATVSAFRFEKLALLPLDVAVTATASSVTGDNTAAKAVDGNENTRWESVQGKDGEYLQLTLASPRKVYAMNILWEAASAKEYKVYFADESGVWTEVFYGNYSQGQRTDVVTPNVIMDVKYIKIEGISRTTTYGYSVFEVQLFGF